MEAVAAAKDVGLNLKIDLEGRLVITGSVAGLYLASANHDAVWRDLGPALQTLLRVNHKWPKASTSG